MRTPLTPASPRLPMAPALAGALLVSLVLPGAASGQQQDRQDLDVPYVPTPPEVVARMLELAGPAPGDTVYDLGSGDGRIVITAAERYGTPGVGVELDSGRVARARENAREAGVSDLVRFVRGDLFDADVRPASIVTLYLFPEVNRKLRPKLFEQLESGDRVVSHDFNMGEWSADRVVNVETSEGGSSTIYYWVMPADVGGTWEARLPGGRRLTLRIDQRYQEFRAEVPTRPGGKATGGRVRADSVSFTLRGLSGSGPFRLRGVVRGDRIEGSVADGRTWSARRTADTDDSILSWGEGEGSRADGGDER